MQHDSTISPKSVLELVTLSDVEPVKVEWLWPDRIALGKFTLIAGDPGLGKSLLAIDIATHVSLGSRWPVDGTNAPMGDVIILSAEDDLADTIVPRLDAAGANRRRVHAIQMVKTSLPETDDATRRSFSLRDDISLLEETLKTLAETRAVIIDPISAYTGNADTHKDSDVRGLLTPLIELAQRQQVAIIGITHLNKGQSKAIYRMMGSVAFVAAARCVLVVAKDNNDPDRRIVAPAKNNLATDRDGLAYKIETREHGPVVTWEPNLVHVDMDDVLSAEYEDMRTEREEAAKWLEVELADGPVKVSDLMERAKQAGHAWTTVKRAKKLSKVVSRKSGFEDGWVWELPNTHNEAHQTESCGPLPVSWSPSAPKQGGGDLEIARSSRRGPLPGNGTTS